MKLFLDFVKLLDDKKKEYIAIEDTIDRRQGQPVPYVLSNGFKVICRPSSYEVRTIMGNNLMPGSFMTAEDCWNAITKNIFSDSPYLSILKYFQTQDSGYLQNIPRFLRSRIKSRKLNLLKVEKDFNAGKLNIDQAVSGFEKVLMESSKAGTKKSTDVSNLVKMGIVPNVGDAVLSVPVDRSQNLNDKIILENLIIFDILTSFPFLINPALRWNKTGFFYLNIQKNLDLEFDSKKRTTVKALHVGWVKLIKESQWKELIWNNLTDWVCRNNRHDKIKTSNRDIWEQFLIAMRVVRYDSSKHHVSEEFLISLQKINIYAG